MMRFGLVALVILQIVRYSMQGNPIDNIIEDSLKNAQNGAQNIEDTIKSGVWAVGDGIKKGIDDFKDKVQQTTNGAGLDLKNWVPDCVFGANNMAFILYTARNYPTGININPSDIALPIQRQAKIRFLVHGFVSEANNTDYFALATTWAKTERGAHILSVQWKEGACTTGGQPLTHILSYPTAVANTRAVGVMIASFTRRLITEYGVPLAGTIIAGHSLGAHIAGFAGKEVQRLGLGKYGMIVGLDPAGPGFENTDCINRLCKTDANFVQALHTSYLAGIHQPVGHVDFYFNLVVSQPGCVIETCNHGRAIQYFQESLRNSNCLFLGRPRIDQTGGTVNNACTPKTCIPMGLKATGYTARGTFNIQTTSVRPYCRG